MLNMVKFTEKQLLVLEKSEIACEDVEMLFGDYVDNELPQSLRDRLDAHIAECEECQQFEEDYRLVLELAKEIGEEQEPAPPAVHNRLRESLNARLGLSLGAV
jgi:anti-sigma factor RsiW